MLLDDEVFLKDKYKAHDKAIYGLEYDRIDGILLSSSEDCTVKLWKRDYFSHWKDRSTDCVHTFKDHKNNSVYDVKCLGAGGGKNRNLIASCDGRGQILIHDIEKLVLERRLSYHSKKVFSIDFDKRTNVLYSCSFDKSVVLYDVREKKKLAKMVARRDDSPLRAIRLLTRGLQLAVGEACSGGWNSNDPEILIFDLRKRKLSMTFVAHSSHIYRIENLSEKDESFASCSVDGTVNIWKYDRLGMHRNTNFVKVKNYGVRKTEHYDWREKPVRKGVYALCYLDDVMNRRGVRTKEEQKDETQRTEYLCRYFEEVVEMEDEERKKIRVRVLKIKVGGVYGTNIVAVGVVCILC